MRMIIADIVADNIEEASTALFQWFGNNLLKNNPDKCHLLISSNGNITMKIGEYQVENSECEELLGAKVDWKLNCDDHISNRCFKSLWRTKCFSQNCTIYRITQKTHANKRLF